MCPQVWPKLGSGRVLLEHAMGPKRGPQPEWLASTAARLTAVRRSLGESAGQELPPALVPPGGPLPGTLHGSTAHATQDGVQQRGQPATAQEELAALRLGRTSPLSAMPCGHAMMIAGRPVVVPHTKNTPCSSSADQAHHSTFFSSTRHTSTTPSSLSSSEPAADELKLKAFLTDPGMQK